MCHRVLFFFVFKKFVYSNQYTLIFKPFSKNTTFHCANLMCLHLVGCFNRSINFLSRIYLWDWMYIHRTCTCMYRLFCVYLLRCVLYALQCKNNTSLWILLTLSLQCNYTTYINARPSTNPFIKILTPSPAFVSSEFRVFRFPVCANRTWHMSKVSCTFSCFFLKQRVFKNLLYWLMIKKASQI